MTKIKTYDSDGVITDKDKVIGSDGDNALVTRNYTFKEIRDFIKQGLSPEIGGTLKLTELTYNGGLYSTPQAFVNSLDPIVTVLKYELVIVSVNGNKWLFRKYDTTIGITETATTLADFVNISTVSDGSQTKLVNGTNTTIYGNGTTATPYSINVTLDGSETKLQAGTNTTVSGNGTVATPYAVNVTFPTIDGSETKVQAGTSVTVSGNGTTATPYIINSTNSVNQDNFVRNITINYTDLPGSYTEQDICNYILALPANQRTILETDSKWNVVILEIPS